MTNECNSSNSNRYIALILILASALLVFLTQSKPDQLQGSTKIENRHISSSAEIYSNSAKKNRFKRKIRNQVSPQLWTRIERDRDNFIANFVPDTKPGLSRSTWINSPLVRFWMDQLSSPDQEQSNLAIQVFELAATLDPMEQFDSNGQTLSGISKMEMDGFGILTTMRWATDSLRSSRNSLNASFEAADLTTADTQKVQELMNNPLFYADSDDSVILEDVRPLIRIFAPRLKLTDEKGASSARSVLNMFSFGIFSDKDDAWWESANGSVDK